jgi:hypothetical protein
MSDNADVLRLAQRLAARERPAAAEEKGGDAQPDNWDDYVSGQTARALWPYQPGKEPSDQQRHVITTGIAGIAPTDSLEDMLAAQMLACHDTAMDCYERAQGDGPSRVRREHLNQAGKLSRTFAMLLDALNRHRGKGQQKITVEHVHVHSGGQAVVGVVEAPGGGVQPKSKDQAHGSKTTAKASQLASLAMAQPSLRGENADLSVSGDAERPLPDTRREVHGRSQG